AHSRGSAAGPLDLAGRLRRHAGTLGRGVTRHNDISQKNEARNRASFLVARVDGSMSTTALGRRTLLVFFVFAPLLRCLTGCRLFIAWLRLTHGHWALTLHFRLGLRMLHFRLRPCTLHFRLRTWVRTSPLLSGALLRTRHSVGRRMFVRAIVRRLHHVPVAGFRPRLRGVRGGARRSRPVVRRFHRVRAAGFRTERGGGFWRARRAY